MSQHTLMERSLLKEIDGKKLCPYLCIARFLSERGGLLSFDHHKPWSLWKGPISKFRNVDLFRHCRNQKIKSTGDRTHPWQIRVRARDFSEYGNIASAQRFGESNSVIE